MRVVFIETGFCAPAPIAVHRIDPERALHCAP
jgi:hypothetical protein